MVEKMIRRIVVFLIIYGLIFLVGFRSGEIANRMKNKTKIETIPIPRPIGPVDRHFYTIERTDHGIFKELSFQEISESNTIMKFFFNKKLRPYLKMRDLKIFSSRGVRIY